MACRNQYYVDNKGECSKIGIDKCIKTKELDSKVCDVCENGIKSNNGSCKS